MIDSLSSNEIAGLFPIPAAAVFGTWFPTDATDTSMDVVSSECIDAPQWRTSAAQTDIDSRAINPKMPPATFPFNNIATLQAQCYDKQVPPAAPSSSPGTVVPFGCPTTPATPASAKKEMNVMAAESRVADWFTRGFVEFPGRGEVKEDKLDVESRYIADTTEA